MKIVPKKLCNLFEYIKQIRPDLSDKQAGAATIVLHSWCKNSLKKSDQDLWVLQAVYEAGLTEEERAAYDALYPSEQADLVIAYLTQTCVGTSSSSFKSKSSGDAFIANEIPESVCKLLNYVKQLRRDLTDRQAYSVALRLNDLCRCLYLAKDREYGHMSYVIHKEDITFEEILDYTSLSNSEKCKLIIEASDSPEEDIQLALHILKIRKGYPWTFLYPLR